MKERFDAICETLDFNTGDELDLNHRASAPPGRGGWWESKNGRKVFTCESLRLSRRTSEEIVFLSCSSISPAHASGIWLFAFARLSGRTWPSGRRELLGTNVVGNVVT